MIPTKGIDKAGRFRYSKTQTCIQNYFRKGVVRVEYVICQQTRSSGTWQILMNETYVCMY